MDLCVPLYLPRCFEQKRLSIPDWGRKLNCWLTVLKCLVMVSVLSTNSDKGISLYLHCPSFRRARTLTLPTPSEPCITSHIDHSGLDETIHRWQLFSSQMDSFPDGDYSFSSLIYNPYCSQFSSATPISSSERLVKDKCCWSEIFLFKLYYLSVTFFFLIYCFFTIVRIDMWSETLITSRRTWFLLFLWLSKRFWYLGWEITLRPLDANICKYISTVAISKKGENAISYIYIIFIFKC